ncbi:hypothetical protein CJ186_09040 [Actinomyces graevenitzii]|nr:hypothetical protein CJ186_09040 [Actinomyces graevenitzii]
MHTSKLSYVLVPLIILSSSAMASPKGETDDDGSSFIVTEREKVTSPGGFSAVAEPAGPVDPEAAKRAAEKYRLYCVTIPKIIAIFDKTEVITPKECTAQANTGAPLAAGPTTVSNEQVARLIPHGSGINRYLSGEIFVIFKQPMMVWTSPDKQTFNITLLGTPIEVEATPVSFNWDWGDGQTFDTTDPGSPYPNYTVSHPYEVTGDGYVIKLRTSWKARWRIAGQTQWHQVNGTVTTTETSSPFNLYFADSYGTTSN